MLSNPLDWEAGELPDFISWAFGSAGIPEDVLTKLRAALTEKLKKEKPVNVSPGIDNFLFTMNTGRKISLLPGATLKEIKGTMQDSPGSVVPITGNANVPPGAINYADPKQQGQSVDFASKRDEVKYDDDKAAPINPFARP